MTTIKQADHILIFFTDIEGALYKAGYSEDGEEIIVYNMTVKATVMDTNSKTDKIYIHNYTVPGHIKDDSGVYPNYNQKNIINERIDKMITKGEINLDHWTLVDKGISLEERWKSEAYYENVIAMGYGDIVPQEYEYLKG